MLIQSIQTHRSSKHDLLKKYAELLIKLLLKNGAKISGSGSEGGYLSRFQITPFHPLVLDVVVVGNFPKEKRPPYLYYSLEKGIRLHSTFLISGHLTSRQSANKDELEFPGAILYDLFDNRLKEKAIISFSGLEPQYDEFISVTNSCCLDYRESITSECPLLPRDILTMYDLRKSLITATPYEHQLMQRTVYELVEIENKNIKIQRSLLD